MPTVTINAPSEAEINQAVNLTATVANHNTDLTLNGGVFTVDYNIPYEFVLTRKDDSTESRAVHNDNQGVLGVYALDSNWIRGSDGELIYGNDNQILEGI